MSDFDTRVGSYAVIVVDGQVLLTHLDEQERSRWTLPGGGLEFGEKAEITVVREVLEETGFRIELAGLLGVESFYVTEEDHWTGPRVTPLHSLCVFFEAAIADGELATEAGGSTDGVAWFDLSAVAGLERLVLVDAGLRLWQERRGVR